MHSVRIEVSVWLRKCLLLVADITCRVRVVIHVFVCTLIFNGYFCAAALLEHASL